MFPIHQQHGKRMRRLSPRRGYALLLVCVFVAIFLAMLGVAWRYVASVLRIEQAIEVRRQCDEGSVSALSVAMQVLESRLYWDGSVAKIKQADNAYRLPSDPPLKCKYYCESASTPAWYSVQFTAQTTDGKQWKVEVAPLTNSATVEQFLPTPNTAPN
jgi:hypothetical protein